MFKESRVRNFQNVGAVSHFSCDSTDAVTCYVSVAQITCLFPPQDFRAPRPIVVKLCHKLCHMMGGVGLFDLIIVSQNLWALPNNTLKTQNRHVQNLAQFWTFF